MNFPKIVTNLSRFFTPENVSVSILRKKKYRAVFRKSIFTDTIAA